MYKITVYDLALYNNSPTGMESAEKDLKIAEEYFRKNIDNINTDKCNLKTGFVQKKMKRLDNLKIVSRNL